ncbi:MAG TPA: AEC family transporter [Syntrophales bacterium]|nr:AEC family transporter [Geobacteraceae bacterium]HPQ43818.1 AEC family transporter [Syntrophales bacterium]
MNIINTIIPIFLIIGVGWFARKKSWMTDTFVNPANRLVYYLAIPALIFKAIYSNPLKSNINVTVLAITLSSVCITAFLVWLISSSVKARSTRGTFIQSSVHGNLGYFGLAVVFYYLGREGLVKASLIAAFMMIVQNFISVFALQVYSGDAREDQRSLWFFAKKIMSNPVILAALLGIAFSLTGLKLPSVISRTLDIISSFALPLALLIIGATLSFKVIRSRPLHLFASSVLKAIVLPGMGVFLFRMFDIGPDLFLPGLILLAAPTATVATVMAKEMNGDIEFAGAAVSLSTLLSAVTYTWWLHFVS